MLSEDAEMGRDRYLPRLLEKGFTGWKLYKDDSLERQVTFFGHVRKNMVYKEKDREYENPSERLKFAVDRGILHHTDFSDSLDFDIGMFAQEVTYIPLQTLLNLDKLFGKEAVQRFVKTQQFLKLKTRDFELEIRNALQRAEALTKQRGEQEDGTSP